MSSSSSRTVAATSFGESNFGGKKSRAMELMEGLVPLGIRWSTLWSSNLCLDKEFLDLARKSGVMHVNIGIESIDKDILDGMRKGWNKASRYHEMFENLRQRDISYSLNFIFGFDDEDHDIYRATISFLEEHKVPAAYFNILTPTKGTALFNRMEKAGRIINAPEIDRWPGQICQIWPKNCSPRKWKPAFSGCIKSSTPCAPSSSGCRFRRAPGLTCPRGFWILQNAAWLFPPPAITISIFTKPCSAPFPRPNGGEWHGCLIHSCIPDILYLHK